MALCPNPDVNCVLSQTHRAVSNDQLDEDLRCYACDASVSCYDYGLLYPFMDCWFSCEINPKKLCVKAVGGPGIPAMTLPKDSDGFQCWTCIDKTDQCGAKFPGATWKTTCDATCFAPDKCKFVGVADGNDCYQCTKPPPPPKTCGDAGLIYRNQCPGCPANKPVCNPATAAGAVIRDESGITCYDCFPKQKTCEEQGLKSGCAADETCDPVSAPNGLACCNCVKKPKTCQDYSMRNQPCQCGPDENKFDYTPTDGKGGRLNCCLCAKNQCHPDMDFVKCYRECIQLGGECVAKTKVRGGPDCYNCKWPDPKKDSCDDYDMSDRCVPNPCPSDTECVMIKPDPRKKLQCAYCEPKETVVDPAPCAEFRKLPSCAPCYQASMGCKWHKVRNEPELHCAECLQPTHQRCEDGLIDGACASPTCVDGTPCTTVAETCHLCGAIECGDGYKPGDCSGDPCKDGERCFDKTGPCYTCEKESCDHAGAIECKTCSECESNPDKMCRSLMFERGGERCCLCEDKPKTSCAADSVSCDSECPQGQVLFPAPVEGDSYFDIHFEIDIPGIPRCCKCVPAGEEQEESKCSSDSDCDDGAFCNGSERCNEDKECSPGTPPCTGSMTCNENTDSCEPNCGDGQYKESTCGNFCSSNGMECVPAAQQGCYQCKCPKGLSEGNCLMSPQICGFGYICEQQGLFCYKCNPLDQETGSQTDGWVPDEAKSEASYGMTPALRNWHSTFHLQATYKYEFKDDEQETAEPNYSAGLGTEWTFKNEWNIFGYLPSWAYLKTDIGYNFIRSGTAHCEGDECKIKTATGSSAVQQSENPPLSGIGGYFGQIRIAGPNDEGAKDEFCFEEVGGYASSTCDGECPPEECVRGQAGYVLGLGSVTCYFCKEPEINTESERIQYFSPRFAGFQLGAQYTPADGGEPVRETVIRNDTYNWQWRTNLTGRIQLNTSSDWYVNPHKYNLTGAFTFRDQNRKTCSDYLLSPSCLGCTLRDMACEPVYPEEGLKCFQCADSACYPDAYTWDECEECEWDGGYCVPAEATTETQMYGSAECYVCVDRPRCDDYGTFCSCMACPPGTQCVPAGRLETGQMCYNCVRFISMGGPFVIAFLEQPPPRQILEAGLLSGFSPQSVLGLMRVDTSSFEQIKQLVDMARSGNVSIVNNLQDLTGLLSGMGKQRAFRKDCFSGLAAAPLPQTPPPLAGAKGAMPKFGLDARDTALINAPIIACGQENGQDVLNIFSASGAKIQSILKDEFAKNPNMLTDALTKADALSSKIMAFQNIDPKLWISEAAKKATSTLAEKLFAPRKPEDNRDKKANTIDPNDPYYYFKPGKKKSAVDERMKKVTKSIFDIGTSAIGMSSSGGINVGKKAIDVDDQWGIRRVGYLPKSDKDSAWNIVDGEQQNIVVAVIDSGLDMTHPDGPAHIWTNPDETPGNGIDDDGNGFVDDVYGWNFLEDNAELTDLKGHGTFVAGIIAAKRNNGIGIAGINPGAIIMPLKVADAEGNTNSLNIYRAIHYAVEKGARVINISLGARGVSEMEASAIRYASAHGSFVAVASGNVGEDIGKHGPASAQGGFAVGAMDFNGERSQISNWGANNGLIAPGEMVYSLRSIDSFTPKKDSSKTKFYYAQSGTSFSTPIVAGTASLLLARDPALTNTDIEDILQATADDIYDKGWDGESGAGILNATRALQFAGDDFVTVKLTRFRVNKDRRDDMESVDVYATVRGGFQEFSIGVGKGKRASRFKKVAGPYTMEADNTWITRIPERFLRGSDEWVIQISVKDKQGKTKNAESLLDLSKPRHINDY